MVLFVACMATYALQLSGVDSPWAYGVMWTFGLGAWAVVFWFVRRRMGPVTFVERQIAHVWAGAMCCVAFIFPLEVHFELERLSMAPLLAVFAGMVFLIKAGILSGSFYIQAITLFVTAIMMVIFSSIAMPLFAFVCAGCFFFSGLKYYRRRKKQLDSRKG